MKPLKKLCCPLLLLLFFVAAAFFPKALVSAADTVDLKLSEGTYRYDYAYQVLDLVNQERAKNNLQPLCMDAELTEVAMQRAAETAIFFSHTRPDGTLCFTACPSKMHGENIASGYISPEAVMKGWMESTGHRENILRSSFQSIGIGCFMQDSRLYWVQCFGNNKPRLIRSRSTGKLPRSSPFSVKMSSLLFIRPRRPVLQKRVFHSRYCFPTPANWMLPTLTGALQIPTPHRWIRAV